MAENYWEYIATAYKEVSIHKGPARFAADLRRFSLDIGDLLAVHWFLSEMSNGGISQFFANPTAVVAERAVVGFSNLGLPKAADALKMSIWKAGDSSRILPSKLFEALGGFWWAC